MYLYLLQHTVLHIQTQIQILNLNFLLFPHEDVAHGHLWSGKLKLTCSPITCFLNSHRDMHTPYRLTQRGYLFICFCDYLLSRVFAAIQQILRVGSHRLQTKQTKTRKFFLPWPGNWIQDLLILNILPYHLTHYTSLYNETLEAFYMARLLTLFCRSTELLRLMVSRLL